MDESYKRLMILRDKYNLSDTEFAEKIGIPKSSMSMYLSGKRKMRQDRIAIVAQIFHVNEAWLLGYDVPMTVEEDVKNFVEHVMKPFNDQFTEKNKPASTFEELRVAYARNRNKLTKEERMKLASEILRDEDI